MNKCSDKLRCRLGALLSSGLVSWDISDKKSFLTMVVDGRNQEWVSSIMEDLDVPVNNKSIWKIRKSEYTMHLTTTKKLVIKKLLKIANGEVYIGDVENDKYAISLKKWNVKLINNNNKLYESSEWLSYMWKLTGKCYVEAGPKASGGVEQMKVSVSCTLRSSGSWLLDHNFKVIGSVKMIEAGMNKYGERVIERSWTKFEKTRSLYVLIKDYITNTLEFKNLGVGLMISNLHNCIASEPVDEFETTCLNEVKRLKKQLKSYKVKVERCW